MTQPVFEAGAALYPSMRASAMMAATTVRYIFDLAVELATAHPEQYAEARRSLEWQTPQQMLKGRETRGAGIVMYSEATRELVKTALATAKERVGKRVEAAALSLKCPREGANPHLLPANLQHRKNLVRVPSPR